MKKIVIATLLVVTMLVMAGCFCKHEWVDADCTTPKTCSRCEETEGAPLGHTWMAATCEDPKTCEECGETEGEALPHNFADATCDAPKTCIDCGTTEGEALGHTWVDATYDAPKTCSVCGATEGEPLKLTDLGLNNDEMAAILDQVMQLIGYKLSYYGTDEDGWPIYDINNASTGAYTGVYVSFEPTADGSKVYALFYGLEDVNNVEGSQVLGAAASASLIAMDENFDVNLFVQTLAGTPEIIDNMAVYYMESCGLSVEMQITEEYACIWIYPAE